MIHDYRELLSSPPRARMLPEQILARLGELEAEYPAIAGVPDPAGVVAEARSGVAACLGLDAIPRAGALEWRVLAELPGDGYTIENGVFEAVPGLIVPAHVYRPAGGGPYPAVVHSLGHWMENARLEPDVQRYNARLARAGMLVLAYDTLGQGERRIGWHQHGQLAPLLVGFTSLGVMVAETMAALDLLAVRDDVDAGRLGVTGASGGGFVSTFVAALDPRVAAAAICCILNTHLGQVRDAALGTGWDGWVDLCNQVPRLAATASMGMVLGAAAPSRVTVVHAVDDPPFPIAGARTVVEEAAAVYEALGTGGHARLVEVTGGHGLHPEMRDAAARALASALGLPPPEPDAPVWLLSSAYAVTHDVARADPPLAQTHVRDPGRLPGEALSASIDTNSVIVEIARARAARLRYERKPSLAAVTAFFQPSGVPGGVRGVVTNHVALAEGFGQRLALDVAAGVTLDAVFMLPSEWTDETPGVMIALDERGKAGTLASAGVASARARGWAVLAPDLRGTGESAAGEFELATASWLLDRDLLASRVDDVHALVQWLSERYSTGQQINARRIAVWGPEAFGLVALLAAVLDERIAGAAGGPFAESLEELLSESPAITPMAFPFGALELFDLADLARLAEPRRLHVVGRTGDAAAAVGGLLDALEAAG
jgi:cephalosporin-C deacetylase-like acetyl esterase